MKISNLFKGAIVLSLSGLICKIIGVLYRIPLANLLGTSGISAYQMAFPVYTLLLVISSAGMPTAISRMTSARVARRDIAGARQVLKVAALSLLAVGVIGSAALFLLSGRIANALMMPSAKWCFAAVSPSLLFVALIAALRGYFQGLRRMTPTAISQITEQAAKLIFSLSLAWKLAPYGAEKAAAGALLGVSISELAALLVIYVMYLCDAKKRKPAGRPTTRMKSTTLNLWKVALPITLGACVMPVVGAIDSAMIMHLMTANGASTVFAAHSYGMLTGYVQPVVGMPSVLSMSLCTSLVPAVSAGRTRERISYQASSSVKMGIFFSLPCAAAIFLLGGDILAFLFRSLPSADIAEGAYLMKLASPGVILLALLQICTGVMQGMGRPLLPAIFLCAGAGLKILVGWMLIPTMGAGGAEIATAACFGLAAVLDLIFARRFALLRVRFSDVLIPALSAALAYVVTLLLMRVFELHVLLLMLIFAGVYLLASRFVGFDKQLY